MRWPHTVRIETRSGSVTQSLDTGAVTADASEPNVLYEGPGDVQHKTRGARRDGDRDVRGASDADVFIEYESIIRDLPEGAHLVAVDEDRDTVFDGRVVGVNPLDGTIFCAQIVARARTA